MKTNPNDSVHNLSKPLTDWEVGQDLIAISDDMCRANSFRESHPEIFKVVDECRRKIGDEFEKLGSHIYSNKAKVLSDKV